MKPGAFNLGQSIQEGAAGVATRLGRVDRHDRHRTALRRGVPHGDEDEQANDGGDGDAYRGENRTARGSVSEVGLFRAGHRCNSMVRRRWGT